MSRLTLPALLLATSLVAQSVVVPNANATNSSTGVLNNPLREAGAPRTYMMGINASQLAAIPPGSLITGLSLRAGHTASNPASWPAADVAWNDYEITVGDVIPPATWSTTFLANFIGTPVLVRDGYMALQAGTYANTQAAPTANPWGEFYFDFQTPFQYSGGDLGVMLTHPGSTASSSIFLEQVAASPTVHGTAMTAIAFQGATSTSTTYVFLVARIHYGYGSPAGCPGSSGTSPMLVQNENITGGGTILLSTANAPVNALGLLVLGFGRAAVPLPNGCTLLASPDATLVVVLDANGRHRQAINIPPGLVGTFNAQTLVLDAGAVGGFTVTNGVEPSAF